jgi:ADP-ribosylglycohydrolase
MSAAQAMIAATGGNTDGIAALTGAFLGAHLGERAIPSEYRTVEGRSDLERLGRDLVREPIYSIN